MGEWSGHMWGSGMRFASLMMIGFLHYLFWPSHVYQADSQACSAPTNPNN